MITPPLISTESSELSIAEVIEKKREVEKAPVEPSIMSKISLAHYPLWTFQRLASEEEIYKQLSSFKEVIELAEGITRAISESRNTSSIYPTSELEVLERLYTFRGKSEVVNFLVNNPLLISFLHEAYEHIKDYFKESQIVLEVITDPEVGDKELVIFICTNLPSDEVYKKLEQLGEEWWLDAPFNVRKKLCIDVEFE